MDTSISKGEFSVASTTVVWKIKNFASIPQKVWVRSNQFKVSNHDFCLGLRRKKPYVNVYLFQEDMSSTMSGIYAQISLVDRHGGNQFVFNRHSSDEEGDNMLQMMNILETFFLLPENALNLRCTVSVENNENSEEIAKLNLNEKPETASAGKNTCLETLSADFGTFYDAHMDCDVLLKVDGVDFAAHRALLSARSSVFAEMLHHDTPKGDKETIDIVDVQPSILDSLLFYMYSGKIRELTPATATRMFTASAKFNLPELRDICLEFIHSNLTIENIGDVALLAEMQSNEALKIDVEKFIANDVAGVLQSSQWKEFTQQQYVLANSILSNVLLSSSKGVS